MIDLRGMYVLDYYISTSTGYSSGTYTAAFSMEQDGDGLLPDDAGRAKRASKSSSQLNESGYVLAPPPTGCLLMKAIGTGVTAYTVTFVARPAQTRPVGHHKAI